MIFMFFSKKNASKQAYRRETNELKRQIELSKTAILSAQNQFEQVVDPTLVDCYIYELNAAHTWYEQAVFYHIYPLGLLGAEKTNTLTETAHRLTELESWIPHISDLNGSAIYIGPLFESCTHGYDTKDFRLVDRRLGSNEDFARFVRLCHENGIRVVVDGVFNHTGREFFAFQDIREKR